MKICIVGSAPHSTGMAPYGSEDWVIWGCSPSVWGTAKQYGYLNRFNGFFEMHRYGNFPNMSPEYRAWLESVDIPVFTSEPVSSLKNNVVVPVDELVKKYGPYWFNSTVSWMMALAIEQKPSQIALYGIDMAANEEYFSQKMGCIRMAERAVEQGIQVTAPYESDLFTPPPLYGVCEYNHAFIKTKIRTQEIQGRLHDAEQRRLVAEQEAHFLRGVIDDMQWSQQTWNGNMAARSHKFNKPVIGEIDLSLTNLEGGGVERDPRIAFQEDASRWAMQQCEADTIAVLEEVYKDELKKKPRKVSKKKS